MARFVFYLWAMAAISLWAPDVTGGDKPTGTVSTGIVKVMSEPSGASVYLNGRVYGPTPVLIELKPGTHSIVVSMDGYPPKIKKVSVTPGRLTSTKAILGKSKSKSGIRIHEFRKGGKDAGPGTVMVTTDPPGLTVVIDDKVLKRTTPVAFDIHSGVYKMKILQKGTVVLEKTLFVRAGHTAEFEFAIKRRRNIDDKDPWK